MAWEENIHKVVPYVPGEQPGEKRKRFRYRLTSEKGQKWADLVREYRECKDKLDELMTVCDEEHTVELDIENRVELEQ